MSRQLSKNGLRIKTNHWHFFSHWGPLLTIIIACSCMTGLGFWQLQRAATKRQMIKQYATQKTATPVPLTQLLQQQSPSNYTLVRTTGTLDTQHLLLVDLKRHHTQLGYHVLVPLKIPHVPSAILVNLGWVSRKNVDQIARIKQLKNPIELTGLLTKASHNPFITQPIPPQAHHFPTVIQGTEIPAISHYLKQPLLPWMLLLSPKITFGFTRAWQPHMLSPERHYFYAAQWFLFASIAAGIFIYLHRRNNL